MKLLCKIFNHKWKYVHKYKFQKSWEKIQCRRCGLMAVLDHSTEEFLEWDEELERCGNG